MVVYIPIEIPWCVQLGFYAILTYCVVCWIIVYMTMRSWMPSCCDPEHMYLQAFFVVLAAPLTISCKIWEALCIAVTYNSEDCRIMRDLRDNPPEEEPQELAQDTDIGPPF